MTRDASSNFDADRRDLRAARPQARCARKNLGGDAERCDGAEEHRFDVRDESAHPPAAGGEAHDRIPDELARPVDRRATASTDAMDLDAAAGERGFIREEIRLRRATTERDRRPVFEKQQRIGPNAALNVACEVVLESQRLAVRNVTEECAHGSHGNAQAIAGPLARQFAALTRPPSPGYRCVPPMPSQPVPPHKNRLLVAGITLVLLGIGNWFFGVVRSAPYHEYLLVHPGPEQSDKSLKAQLLLPPDEERERRDIAYAKLDFYGLVQSGGRIMMIAGVVLAGVAWRRQARLGRSVMLISRSG